MSSEKRSPSSPELRLGRLNGDGHHPPSPPILIQSDDNQSSTSGRSCSSTSDDDDEQFISSIHHDDTTREDPPSPILGISNRNYTIRNSNHHHKLKTSTPSEVTNHLHDSSQQLTLTNHIIYNTNLIQNKWSKLMTPFDIQLTQHFDMKRSFISNANKLHDHQKNFKIDHGSKRNESEDDESSSLADSPSKYLEQIQFSQIPASLMIPSNRSDKNSSHSNSSSGTSHGNSSIHKVISKKPNSSSSSLLPYEKNKSHNLDLMSNSKKNSSTLISKDFSFQTPPPSLSQYHASSSPPCSLSTNHSTPSNSSTCSHNEMLNTSLLGDDLLLDDIKIYEESSKLEQYSPSNNSSNNSSAMTSSSHPFNSSSSTNTTTTTITTNSHNNTSTTTGVVVLKPPPPPPPPPPHSDSASKKKKKKKSSPNTTNATTATTATLAPKQVVKIRNNAERKEFERSKNKFENWLKFSSPDKINVVNYEKRTTLREGHSSDIKNETTTTHSSSSQESPNDKKRKKTTTTTLILKRKKPNSIKTDLEKTLDHSTTSSNNNDTNNNNNNNDNNQNSDPTNNNDTHNSDPNNATNYGDPNNNRSSFYELYFSSAADGLCFTLGEECKSCHEWLEKHHIESNTNEYSGYMTCIHCQSNKFKPSLTIQDDSTNTIIRIVSFVPKNKLLELLNKIQHVNSQILYENHEELFWNVLYHYGSIKECLDELQNSQFKTNLVGHNNNNTLMMMNNIGPNENMNHLNHHHTITTSKANNENTFTRNKTDHTTTTTTTTNTTTIVSTTTTKSIKKEKSKKKETTQTKKNTKKQLSQKSLFDFMK
ncbi:hypothetical protein FDP41_009021 [Naegleria fowleri]|uniref:Uncharacterized protein n=1 Tax=Naegleria fowleri TaxID=5763 RepID=A0A6A5BD43_NAEFO|nr:uncharacterized protein FDP41_009021 [Naegleria fowleri]KAF0972772.1 hypothetical protein FDP41_009021 [Naegleria fowleri]